MTIDKDDLEMFAEILEEAESFRPLVEMGINALKSYSKELAFIPEALSIWIVKCRIASINQYENAGFDRHDAITMSLADAYSIREITNRLNNIENKRKDQKPAKEEEIATQFAKDKM